MKTITIPDYGTEIEGVVRREAYKLDGENRDDINFYAARLLTTSTKPAPSMAWGARMSQIGNSIHDWLSYYWSPVKDIPMDLKEIDKGFKVACRVLNSPERVNEFYSHRFTYRADKTPEDEFKKPRDVWTSRWKDVPYRGNIADDCDGAAALAHYVIMTANKQDPAVIYRKLIRGVRDNVIFCMFDEKTGHATNLHRRRTVCNLGLIDHGTENVVKIGHNLINDAEWFSFYIFQDGEYRFLEAGDELLYKKEVSAHKYTETGLSTFGALTPNMLDGILEQSRGKAGKSPEENILEVGFGALDKMKLEPEAIDSIERGLNMELKQRTPLRQIIARKIGVRPARIKVV